MLIDTLSEDFGINLNLYDDNFDILWIDTCRFKERLILHEIGLALQVIVRYLTDFTV